MSDNITTIRIVNDLIVDYININNLSCKSMISESLQALLNGNYTKYYLEKQLTKNNVNNVNLQKALSNINEKTDIRKQKGVFYTPEDVAHYIIWNSIIMHLNQENEKTYKENLALEFIKRQSTETIDKLLYQTSFIDPTCGSGEFLLSALKVKLVILKECCVEYTDHDVVKICRTIYGNDIDDCSTDIAKIRLFLEFVSVLKNKNSYRKIAELLAKQFFNKDFVLFDDSIKTRFDFVIGNPPYVEYGKFEKKELLKNSYGNIYADVIQNSFSLMKNNGVLGFVVPLSYVSTARMSKIRDYVYENSDREFILSFADRPDCLFAGVHQKLNIMIARKSRKEHLLFTSNYRHWYKDERGKLLNGCEIKRNTHNTSLFIPKIGNILEESIFRKINTTTHQNIFEVQNVNGKSLFLNMRACFWIKAFSFNPGSKEYKEFKFDEKKHSFVLCLLNSSLFWIFWTMTSDCWHITSKELKGFLIPEVDDVLCDKFTELGMQLETELEKTKKYIGTKQTDYEYKHKECKAIIDTIDETLAEVYNLTQDEVLYVKNFAMKYRTGSGTNDKSN